MAVLFARKTGVRSPKSDEAIDITMLKSKNKVARSNKIPVTACTMDAATSSS